LEKEANCPSLVHKNSPTLRIQKVHYLAHNSSSVTKQGAGSWMGAHAFSVLF